MTAALVIVAAFGLCFGAFSTWSGRQERERLLDWFAHQADTWADERRVLLNRIEPSTAQHPTGEQTVPEVTIPFDNDEAFAEMTAAMSKEQFAAMMFDDEDGGA